MKVEPSLFVKTEFSATVNNSLEAKILYYTYIPINVGINLVLQSDLRC
jgi:hypothetical protein